MTVPNPDASEVDRLRARVAHLEGEVSFWRDQQKFAASVAATVADLDEQAPAMRQMLRTERERRRRAEDEVDRLTYRLMTLEGTQP